MDAPTSGPAPRERPGPGKAGKSHAGGASKHLGAREGRVSVQEMTEGDWEAKALEEHDLLIRPVAHTRRLTKAQLEQLDEWLQQPPIQGGARRWQ
jgi:hypothetical protein